MTKETTHVRIDRDVKVMLEAQAGPGESVNDVIRRLVTDGPVPVNEQVNREVNSSPADLEELVNKAVNFKLTSLEERLDTLNKIIEQLEQQQTKEPEPETATDQPDHHLTTQFSQVNEQVAPAGGDEWVMITDDVRSQLVNHLSKLQAGGMSYSKIGTMVGMGKGRFTELHQGKLKKMHREQYEALISIK